MPHRRLPRPLKPQRRHVDPPARHAPGLRPPTAGQSAARHALLNGPLVERLARTFRALGDPNRSRLVLALSLEEMCVSDLAEALGASLSATSHQLRILRDLEIVRVRRAGRSQVYTLNEQAFGFCAPRLCHAWQQTLDGDGLVRPAGAAHAPRAGLARRSGR